MKRFFQRMVSTVKPVSGITSSDWLTIHNTILREYESTARNHKRKTEYMRGLSFALEVLDGIRPYNIAEVQ